MSASPSSNLRAMIVALVGNGLGLALLSYLAVDQWLSPFAPAMFMICGVAIVVTLLNSLLHMPAGEIDLDLRYTRGAVIWSLGTGLVATVLSMVWLSSGVRVNAVETLTERGDRATLMLALSDESHAVSVAACAGMIQLGMETSRSRVLERLSDDPYLARDCLARVAHLPEGQQLSAVLTSRIYNQFMAMASRAPSNACLQVGTAAQIPGNPGTTATALLSCALTAETDVVRDCCANALKSSYNDGAELAHAVRKSNGDFSRLAPHLLRASFHKHQLDERAIARVDKLGLNHADFQAFAVATACGVIENKPNDHATLINLSLAAEAAQCLQPGQTPPQSAEAWSHICAEIAPHFEELFDPEVVLCQAVRESLRIEAVRSARILVHAAIEAYRQQRLDVAIRIGDAQERRDLYSINSYGRRLAEETARLARNTGGPARMTSHSMSRLLGRDMAGTAKILFRQGANHPIPDPFALFKQFEDNFDIKRMQQLDAFKNLSEEEKRKFFKYLKQYQDFKDDDELVERFEQIKEEFEKARDFAEGEVEAATEGIDEEIDKMLAQ